MIHIIDIGSRGIGGGDRWGGGGTLDLATKVEARGWAGRGCGGGPGGDSRDWHGAGSSCGVDSIRVTGEAVGWICGFNTTEVFGCCLG